MSSEPQHSVLIVEDERIVALDLKQVLAEMGYDAFAIASSADEALRHASARCPDVVLMDIRIKGACDGIETATLLHDRFDVPVVYLTAHADAATLDRAKRTEPYGYLMKPVKPAELRNALEVAIYKHEVERRLRVREQWFATTLRSIADAVITVDLGGTITYLNPAAEALIGTTAAEALGRPAREVVRLAEPRSPASPLDEVLANRVPLVIGEATLADSERIIGDSAAPVMSEGEMVGAVMVFRDITQEKSLQRQLELADRLASLGTMAAGVAHEVNNPLAVVMGNATFVLEELRAVSLDGAASGRLAEAIAALVELESAAARIARIVGELRTFSRPAQVTTEATAIGPAVAWAVRSTSAAYGTRGRVTVQVDPGLRVQLDETRLGQVLVNLLLNAAQAIPAGPREREVVAISASGAGAEVLIEVRDVGSGMSAEVLAHIFEPFYTTKPIGVGTGLGLAICHGIVTAAGGRITAESSVGVGTTFRISLPAAQPHPAPVVASSAVPARSVRRGRILAVDDEPMILQAVRRVLREHDVVGLGDAREALALLDGGERYDVILSDMMMPHMTGMEFYEALLVRHPDAARRVVFLTGAALTTRVADFLAVIPNLALEKPIATAEFRALVEQLLTSVP
jgi:PAS domain S-box-containing protein